MNLFRRALSKLTGPRIDAAPAVSPVHIIANYSGAVHSQDRTWLPGYVQGARQDINPGDRIEMVRRSRYFERNNALFQKVLDLIETNVVGTGISVTPDSSDPTWNAAALEWWRDWCAECDVSGVQTFATMQAVIARAQAVDGEIFVFLTYGERGMPRLQLIETQRIRSADVRNYTREGYSEFDGILFDQFGRPAFYVVSNDSDAFSSATPSSVAVASASSIIHVFEPSRAGQARGLPLAHAVLHTLHDLDDLQRYEMLAAKDAASRANIVKTESGEAPGGARMIGVPQRQQPAAGSSESAARTYYEQAFGGKTVVLKRGDDWKQSESLRPSAAMREFWEYLTETCCKGVGISFAAVQDYRGQWGGAALRGAIASDNRFYQVRTDSLVPAIRKVFEHALGWAIDAGRVPAPPADWRKIKCHSPRRSTVDIGRESAAILNELRVGLRTFRDVLGETGSDWREIIRQRIAEQKFIADTARELGVPSGLVLGMLGAAANTNTFGEKAAEAVDGEDTTNKQIAESGVTAVQAHSADSIGSVLAFIDPRAIELPESAEFEPPAEFVWMPAGEHSISAGSLTDEPFRGKVVCDESAATTVAESFAKQVSAGQIPWIDFNHADDRAAAWVRGFRWDSARGIICSVEWTTEGKAALAGKSFRSFSPAFLASRDNGKVFGLIPGHAAGGLVNAPAFGAAMPALVAARLGDGVSNKPAPGGIPVQTNTMTKEQMLKLLAALKISAPADATEAQLMDLLVNANAPAEPATATASVAPSVAPAVVDLAAELASVKAAQADMLKQLKAAQSAPAVAPVVASNVSQVRAASGIQTVRAGLVDALKGYNNTRDNSERAEIFASAIQPAIRGGVLLTPVLAANSLGTLSGDLVARQALAVLKYEHPLLSAISSDFSAENAAFGQAVKTRLRGIPTVTDYSTTTGYATSDASATDVSVTLNAHKAVQIKFTANELASTNRDLFGENVETAHSGLADAFYAALFALITAGNFTNGTVKATASLTRADIVAMAKALFNRKVARAGRFCLLNADTYEKIMSDTAVVNLATAQQADLIGEYKLPRIAGFDMIQAVDLPATGNLTGFSAHPSSLAIATRVPNDYTAVFGGAGAGAITTVSSPDSGISVALCQYVDHTLGAAFWRIAVMYGVAVGNGAAGQRLTSA